MGPIPPLPAEPICSWKAAMAPQHQGKLVSPAIDISPLATAELRFKYHMYGSNINKLVVIAEETSSGLQTRLDSLMGQQQTAGSDSFLLRTTSLQSLSGNTYRFIFQAFKGSSFRGDISIDEVRVDASCLGYLPILPLCMWRFHSIEGPFGLCE